VTLTEAFEYARQQTIRDTARQAREPQHPSFALNLRGRQDLVLAQIAASPSTLAVGQERGPLELVHLASGLRMLELPPGPRVARVAVPPGRYLVRRIAPDGVRAREIDVPRQGQVEVQEDDLVLVASERLVVKGPPVAMVSATPAARSWDLSLRTLIETDDDRPGAIQVGDVADTEGGTRVRLDGRVGITDRLAWRIGTLAFAYRMGSEDGTEVVPYGGLLGWSVDYRGSILLGAGVGLRQALGRHALVATVGADYSGVVEHGAVTAWPIRRFHASAGYGVQLGSAASAHLAAMVVRWVPDLAYYSDWPAVNQLVIGSVQELGLGALPLVRLQLPASWSLDLHAAVTTVLGGSSGRGWSPAYGVAITRAF
jgi:hypothetical protein